MPKMPSLTRKSLTAHYYPNGYDLQDAPIKRMFSIYDHLNPSATLNPLIKKAATINPFIYSSICLAMNKMGGMSNLFTRDKKFNAKFSDIRRLD